MQDYKSKGVHTNRKGGKMSVKPYDRTGAPFKPKPRTTMDAIDSAIKAGGGKEAVAGAQELVKDMPPPKGGIPVQKIGAALTKGASDMAAQNAAAQAQFDAEHQRAVQEGSAMHQRMRQSTPGKAMSIIKNKRV